MYTTNMESQANLKILISGSGIAGNALAFWLTRLGHHVTIIEKFPGLRATGLQYVHPRRPTSLQPEGRYMSHNETDQPHRLDIRGAGIEVMKRMNLEEAFRAKRVPEEGMQVVDSKGRQRAWFPATTPKSGGRQGFTSEYEIMRGDICHILHDAALINTTRTGVKNSGKLIYGTSIKSLEQKADAVKVKFEDGSTGLYDLLVGADGQWSRTRRMMLAEDPSPSKTEKPHSDGFHPISGLYFSYFTMQQSIQEGEGYMATSYLTSQRRGIMTRRHSPNEIQVMLSCRNDSDELRNIPRGDVRAEKQAMANIFRGAGWQSDQIVEGMKEAPDFYCERLGLVKLSSWSCGRVTLVGDAAYCPTVLTGMGTTCAMVGAYILAGEIGRHAGRSHGKGSADGLAVALKSYEDKFRPFMDQVQSGVVESSTRQWMFANSPMQVGIFNLLMGVASFFAKRMNIVEAFGIKEMIKGWELPMYEELGYERD